MIHLFIEQFSGLETDTCRRFPSLHAKFSVKNWISVLEGIELSKTLIQVPIRFSLPKMAIILVPMCQSQGVSSQVFINELQSIDV